MNKKQANERKNKAKKQLAAFNNLMTARKQGTKEVLKILLKGNRFVRQVVQGRHLMEGVKRFILNADEETGVQKHMHEQAEEFRNMMEDRKSMKEMLAWALLDTMEILTPKEEG